MRFSFTRSSPIRTGMETTVYPLTDIVTSDLKRHSEINSPAISRGISASRHRAVEIDLLGRRHADAKCSKRSAVVRRVRDGHAHATPHADTTPPHPRFGSSGDVPLVAPVSRCLRQVC